MLELSGDVVELCQEHGLGAEWIERASRPDELLERSLEECARLSASHGKLSEASLLELRGLVLLALLAHERQERPSEAAAGRLKPFFEELAMLCHRINNPLTSLMGRSQMLGRKVKADADSPLAKEAQVIEESAKRVAALVQELSQFAGQTRAEILGTDRPR